MKGGIGGLFNWFAYARLVAHKLWLICIEKG